MPEDNGPNMKLLHNLCDPFASALMCDLFCRRVSETQARPFLLFHLFRSFCRLAAFLCSLKDSNTPLLYQMSAESTFIRSEIRINQMYVAVLVSEGSTPSAPEQQLVIVLLLSCCSLFLHQSFFFFVVFYAFLCARQVVTPPLPPPALPLRYPTAMIPWKGEVTPVGSVFLCYL